VTSESSVEMRGLCVDIVLLRKLVRGGSDIALMAGLCDWSITLLMYPLLAAGRSERAGMLGPACMHGAGLSPD
jgi:hypothetical protein